MEQNGGHLPIATRWECPDCGYNTSLDVRMANMVHQLTFPECSSGLLLNASQQLGSEGGSSFGPGHLESDDAIRLGRHHRTSLRQSLVQNPQEASSAADFLSASRWSDDMVTAAPFQRREAIRQHPNSSPQPPGRTKDEGACFSSGQPNSYDGVYHRDYSEDCATVKAADQQLTNHRIQQAIGIIQRLRCGVCMVKWRSIATPYCLHMGNCETCYQNPETNRKCAFCRGNVVNGFPVKFHSTKLLEDLDIPIPLTVTIETEQLQIFLTMGFSESQIGRAIHLIQLQNENEVPLDQMSVFDTIFDLLEMNPQLFPSAEEMEKLLGDQNVDNKVKSRLCDYLEATSKCMVCRCNSPSICLIPCMHLALCKECRHLPNRPTQCPDCGTSIANNVAVILP